MMALVVPSLILFFFELMLFLKRPLSVFRFFTFCYATIVGLGVPMVLLIDTISGYKFPLRDLDTIQSLYVAGYVLLYVGALPVFFAARLIKERYKLKLTKVDLNGIGVLRRPERAGLATLGLLSLGATAAYLATTGFSFGSSGYESRYEDAAGAGLFLLFIPAFLPYAAYRLASARTTRRFLLIALVVIAFNAFVFMLLNGYRQLLIASALLCVIVAVERGILARWTIVPAAIFVFPLLAVSMSFARYAGEESTPFNDKTTAALYYIQGDIFPIDAPMRIMWYCEAGPCPGFNVFVSHLQKFVPRPLWPDKPALLPDAAGYYTKTVLNYKRNLTLSVTILGEALFMDSYARAALVFLISGFMASLLTVSFAFAKPSIGYYIYLANIYIGFFWVREGLEDAINRMIIMSVYGFIGFFSAVLWATIMRRAAPVRVAVSTNVGRPS